MNILGAKHDINVRSAFEDALFGLLGHAARHGNLDFWILGLELAPSPQMAVSLVFRRTPNLAGVHNQQIRFQLVLYRLEAFFLQQPQHHFRIIEVHLTAKRFQVDFARDGHNSGAREDFKRD